MNTERMDGRVFVITGAASGMGAAMAHDFAQRGAKIAIFDLDDEHGTKVADEIVAAGGTAAYYHVSVTDKAAIQQAADKVEEQLWAPSTRGSTPQACRAWCRSLIVPRSCGTSPSTSTSRVFSCAARWRLPRCLSTAVA